MTPVPRTSTGFPPCSCGLLRERAIRIRAAPACCVFVAAEATGSSASALLAPPPHPADIAANAATVTVAATVAQRLLRMAAV